MLDTIQFAEEMKRVLGLPASHNVDIEKPICKLSTDEVLSPDGFDLRIGRRVFHFNLKQNESLIRSILVSSCIPQEIKNEVNAVLKFSRGEYKGTRTIFEKGKNHSNYCRVCLGIDYYLGLDGTPTFKKDAIDVLQKDETDELVYIKDRKLRARAVFLMGKYEEQKRSKYYKLAADIDRENAGYSREYASFLFNKNRRLDAYPYYKHAADLGDIEACHMTGISYALGFNEVNEGKNESHCSTLLALPYLRKSNRPERYAYIGHCREWSIISYGDWNLWEKSCEEIKKGVELGFSTCYEALAWLYYHRAQYFLQNNEKKEALTCYKKAYNLFQMFYSGKTPSLLSWYYGQEEAFHKTRLWYKINLIEKKKEEIEVQISKLS